MIAAIADTTVIVHLIRRIPSALEWSEAQQQPIGITTITWIEIMRGENNKRRHLYVKSILKAFMLVHVEHADQEWVMDAVERDPGLGMADALIAAVASRLKVPLYTHNLADMRRMLPGYRVIQPYKL